MEPVVVKSSRGSKKRAICMTIPTKRGLTFSRDINAGHILTAITILIGMVVGYAAFYSRLSLLEYRQVQMDQIISELKTGNAQAIAAIQDIKTSNARLTFLAEQIQRQLDKHDLQH